MWTGWIATEQRERYRDVIGDTGMTDYLATPGNLGAWMAFRDAGDGRTEVTTVSLWESREAIVAFAGEDIEVARYYPEDDEFLIDRDPTVKHYEVLS